MMVAIAIVDGAVSVFIGAVSVFIGTVSVFIGAVSVFVGAVSVVARIPVISGGVSVSVDSVVFKILSGVQVALTL